MASVVVDRKALRQALYQRLQDTMQSVRWWAPRYVDFAAVPVKPALTLAVESQIPQVTPGRPPVWVIKLIVSLHIQPSADPSDTPDDTIDDLLAELEVALRRQADEDSTSGRAETTLGGLCSRCYIAGEITYWDAGHHGATVVDVPIEIQAITPPG